ncbi:hypothetical protein B0H63DRAFT_445349 [Podospora didyma]|uniref:Uncharacterized protein n=1 Tax=Podospora didyma TaxID=330526 RepID=A0AAE0P8G7_9PEZI|nr:hypothetical protein B0H63DRAFT_445349 [Podospora didyma]
MLGRHSVRQEDPFRRINAWDDELHGAMSQTAFAGLKGETPTHTRDVPHTRKEPDHEGAAAAQHPVAHPSPPGHRPRDHEYERDRAEDHDRHPTSRREHSPRSSGSDRRHKHHHSSHRRSPSPSHRRDKPAPAAAAAAPTTHRPTISRSKTTSAKERFANLSPKWQKAAAAAFQAGSLAALNMRSEPGPWKGEKGARIATAALGAAALDAFAKEEKEVEKKNSSSGGGSKSKSGGGLSSNKKSTGAGPDVEALGGVLGGFLIDQIAARRQSGKGRDKHHH